MHSVLAWLWGWPDVLHVVFFGSPGAGGHVVSFSFKGDKNEYIQRRTSQRPLGMAFQPDRGRPPGEIPQILDQNQFPGQGQDKAHAMSPGAPAREMQHHDMMNDAKAVHENHIQRGV